MGNFQSQYDIYQQEGWPGALARASEPHAYHRGLVHVPTNGRKPRPGDAVYYDATQDSFAAPINDDTLRRICGIVSFDRATLQETLSSIPAGANSSAFIEYDDGAVIKIGVFGTFFAEAQAAMEYGQVVTWDRTNFGWSPNASTPPAVAVANATGTFNLALLNSTKDAIVAGVQAALNNIPYYPAVCVSRSPVAASGIAEIKIGSGRVL